MVHVSPSRQALDPLYSNLSADTSASSLASKPHQPQPPATHHTRRTSRSDYRAKLAHASSAQLDDPADSSACIVQLPLLELSTTDMQSAHIRARLKRKKGAHSQLGITTNPTNHAESSSASLNALGVGISHTHVPSALRRARSAASRNSSNKPLNIITSPHIARDKPSSSASELSDWSSIASASPTASRPPSSSTDQSAAVHAQRPGIQTRRSSRNSLHKTLDAMSLEDSIAVGLGIHRSRRSQSRSMSRQSSNGTAGHAESLATRLRPHRSVSSGAALDSDHSSDELVQMDDQDAENDRLISSAPNWQLHRLRKVDLIHLSLTAGAWELPPTADQLELLTKHDLVNKIITCRSRLDRSQSHIRQSSGPIRRHQPTASPSQRSFDQPSPDVFDQDADECQPLFMSSSRKASARLRRQSHGASPSYSTDGRNAHLSEDSNEAGGEETEAEPQRSHLTRRGSHRAKSRAQGTLRRMDSSTFDQLEPSKSNQAPRRQLRDKTSFRGARTRRLRVAAGSEPLSASTSSSIFGGRSSRASNTSFSPFAKRYQHNLFVASSPIKTRSRTARLNLTMAKRRSDAASSALDIMATPRPGDHRSRRAKKTVKFNASSANASNDQAEDDWMEDLSSDSEAVAAALIENTNVDRAGSPSRGSHRNLRTRRPTADSDPDVTFHQPRSRSVSVEVQSEFDTEVPAPEDDDDADMASSDEDAPTPTKFRKLRNGKLRLVAGPSRGNSGSASPEMEQVDDVDMESVSEATAKGEDSGRVRHSGSPESGEAPIEGIEDAMVQPNTTTLLRLRKSELEELCLHREIDVEPDDKKANLVHKLLQWHQLNETGPAAANNSSSDRDSASGDDEGDKVDVRSNMPTATATAEDEAGKSAQRTPTRRRNTRAISGTHPDVTDSDQPLLLRARGKKVSSDKLPTPPLTSNNEEANPPQAGDGVDELNGLDLESLNLTDKEIHPSKLEKLEKIGSGGFKDVYVGKYRISKARVNKVAIADIRDQLTEMDIKELSLLRDLRHENIVRFIGVSIPEDPRHVPCMIVSELCSNGDLFDYIRNTPAPCDAEVFRILLETARGLEYLHTRTPAIIHRDCKSTNVLITRRKTAKINDFGLARVKNTSRSMMRSLVGTVNWQAVELWVPKPNYNEKVDVWSAAMTFWEALQWHQPEKKYPFQGMNEHQIYQDVGQKRQRPYTGAIRRQFGGEIVDLLDRMWDQTPKNRPTMTKVCNELEALIQMKKKEDGAAAGKA